MFNEFTWLFLIIFFISFPFLLLLWLFLSSYYYIWSNWVITFQVNRYVLCISVNTSHKSMYGGICRIRILLSITNYNSGEIGPSLAMAIYFRKWPIFCCWSMLGVELLIVVIFNKVSKYLTFYFLNIHQTPVTN